MLILLSLASGIMMLTPLKPREILDGLHPGTTFEAFSQGLGLHVDLLLELMACFFFFFVHTI